MNAPTDIQIIRQPDGLPAFAVIPWDDYVANYRAEPMTDRVVSDGALPNAVVGYMVRERLSPAAAWRKYLGLSQATVAARIGISQSASYAQQEMAAKLRKATRGKIAQALGIAPVLLELD